MRDLLDYRSEFPGLAHSCYLVSHSMGCMPARAREYVNECLDLWEQRAEACWDSWFPEVEAAGARISKLLSAAAPTVCVQQNVSTAMSVVASCFEYRPGKNKIVYSDMQFPSVSYVWKAEERRGAEVCLVRSEDGVTVDTQAMVDAIDERTLLVPISHVLFRSSYVQDVKSIAAKAASVEAHVVLDVYQSLGCMPIDVVDMGVSFACGGSHKWLCGSGGAGFLYVRADLHGQLAPRQTGWFAHESPFAFSMPDQRYATDSWRFMNGTVAATAIYQAKAGQEIVLEIGASRIRENSVRQTQRIIEIVQEKGFKLNSPKDSALRGGSVVFDFVGAPDVAYELNRRRFYCDYRPGAGIRVGPHFYNRDDEIFAFFAEIDEIRGVRK